MKILSRASCATCSAWLCLFCDYCYFVSASSLTDSSVLHYCDTRGRAPSVIYMCSNYNLLQPFNGIFSGTTWVSQYQKGKTNRDFTGARDSEWQWHQLGHMQVCTSLQTDNHASTPPLSFLQARCPFCRPTNSVKALKAQSVQSAVKFTNCCSFWLTWEGRIPLK